MIHIENIQVGYGHCVVAEFAGDIAFAKARLIALIGTNGSGKSTFLRAVASGEHLINGTIKIDDKNWQEITPRDRSKLISIVLTERSFSYFLTVRELLELSRAPYTNYMGKLAAKDHEIINEVLEKFDLLSLHNRKAGTLSDGQLQRVLIARAIVQDTDYIIMDEPTSHLDINHKADLLLQLKEYCHENNKTILFATHELQLALSLCDEVVSIDKGSIVHQSIAQFHDSKLLQKMFPSKNLIFKNGTIYFNF
ncbi:ABC transporter ATP-binding protein [Nonlabens dokdonensis]|uniref:ABC transporter ATP-binding protein n=1 Tax=Nonlabens dokdonensis TaxID=328515 RepID=UPI0026EA76FD|nr:ABC transporter ATP-binding protein [Nonlabens dokdonensis]